MGQAKLRREAADRGKPLPAPRRCPVKSCRSTAIIRHDKRSLLAEKVAKAWGNKAPCVIEQCADCDAFWEAWPDDDPGDLYRDDVEREPCNNCAYRAGSRESQDKAEWLKLKELARQAADLLSSGTQPRWFCCHKGIPIRITDQGIEFDFEAADRNPIIQTCKGFLNAMWAHQKGYSMIPDTALMMPTIGAAGLCFVAFLAGYVLGSIRREGRAAKDEMARRFRG